MGSEMCIRDSLKSGKLGDPAPLYRVPKPISLSEETLKKQSVSGIGDLIDQVYLMNPDFMQIKDIADLGPDNLAVREYQRPCGYSANTRVHMGRLCIPTLNDSGATCACVTEEQIVLLVNHTQQLVKNGHMSTKDYNYPLREFYYFKNKAYLKGADANGQMLVEYAALLRVEFIPDGSATGPANDIYFKDLQEGHLRNSRSRIGMAAIGHAILARR